MDERVVSDRLLPGFQLRLGGQFAVHEEVRHLGEGSVLGELLYGIAAVAQDPGFAVEFGDGAARERCGGQARVVKPDARQKTTPFGGVDAPVGDRDLHAAPGAVVCDRDAVRSHMVNCNRWLAVEGRPTDGIGRLIAVRSVVGLLRVGSAGWCSCVSDCCGSGRRGGVRVCRRGVGRHGGSASGCGLPGLQSRAATGACCRVDGAAGAPAWTRASPRRRAPPCGCRPDRSPRPQCPLRCYVRVQQSLLVEPLQLGFLLR